jgi:hypothetical protein
MASRFLIRRRTYSCIDLKPPDSTATRDTPASTDPTTIQKAISLLKCGDDHQSPESPHNQYFRRPLRYFEPNKTAIPAGYSTQEHQRRSHKTAACRTRIVEIWRLSYFYTCCAGSCATPSLSSQCSPARSSRPPLSLIPPPTFVVFPNHEANGGVVAQHDAASI